MRAVFVTLPAQDAEAMLLLLLRERLVAGGSILPTVHSRYWWNGEIVAQQEAAILMETADDRLDEAVARIRELHPFDSPRILVLNPSTRGVQDYYRWVFMETRG
ncbi:MAG: divalent-cation tolerance protein CutA [Alphaproteobacteria bacterium]|nr:divalent-cation tolerance protein CutA [Alphaproteobacteria bacterium]MCB9793882.1 divalent-cation tolerance protein CutA [Alphaproteobacteria bacterium]